jgi:periplasmic protein TonB
LPEALRVTIVLPRISRFFTGSFVAHLLATIAVIWLPTLWRGPILPPDALAVELVGALPEIAPPAPPAGSTERAEETEEPPAPPDEATIATPPPAPATPKPKPKPSATPKPAAVKPRPSPPPEPAPTNGPATGTGSAGAATAGSAAAGGSVSALEGLDSAFGWYRAAVTQALFARWQRPIVDGLTAPVEVRVAFSIQRDGRVQSIQLEQSSGVPSLDRSALRAVTDASPLPPLPAGIDGPFLAASFVFRLYPEGGG